MTTYFISFELNNSFSQDEFYSKLESLGELKQFSSNAWFLISESSAKDIRDALGALMDQSERLMVMKASSPAAWRRSMTDNKWVIDNLK